jgi:transposase-like protein
MYEIIIIDNGSTDGTREISQHIIEEASNRKICHIFEPEAGLLAGRHRGALEAEIAPNRPDTVSHVASVSHTTVSMSNPRERVEIITSVQRRRRWTAAEKVRMVEETFEPGMTVSLVARRHGGAPDQLFTWRRLVVEGALTAAGSGEQVVPASDYRALQSVGQPDRYSAGASLSPAAISI